MSDPKDQTPPTPADEPAAAAEPAPDGPAPAEEPAAGADEATADDGAGPIADTVAANVDAPAGGPADTSEATAAPTPPDDTPPAAPPSSDDSAATPADDTVAANVDAPAESPADQPTETISTDTKPIETVAATPAEEGEPKATDDAKSEAATAAGEKAEPAAGEGAEGAPAGSDGAPAAPLGDGDGTGVLTKKRRNPWPTVATLLGVLLLLAAFGYFGGLGPLNRLSTTRDLNPPNQIAGLNRITDAETRERLQLDATRDALSRINDGKKATVEAYGDPAADKMYVVIALRGKVDIDKTIKDSGATPEQIKKVGKSTCAATGQDLPTSCYRGSNTLTVIAQGLTDKTDVNQVGAVADEAFDKMS